MIAGKLMLMAWSILRMQSEQVLSNSRHETTIIEEIDLMDMFSFDEPRAILCMPDEVMLDEVVRHRGAAGDAGRASRCVRGGAEEEELNKLREKLRRPTVPAGRRLRFQGPQR